MTVHAVIYSGDQIIKTLTVPNESSVIENTGVGESYLLVSEKVNQAESYILAGVITPRPLMNLVISNTTVGLNVDVVITGIPNPTTLYHPGGAFPIVDGNLDWSSAEPGTFKLRFLSYPYIEEIVHVTVEL